MQSRYGDLTWLWTYYISATEKLKNIDIIEFDKQPEKIFFICSLLFGLFCLFITPPFQAPDEYSHFFRAYYSSQGGIIGDKAIIPGLLYQLSQTFPIDYLPQHSENKQNINIILKEFSKPFIKLPAVEVNINNTIFYSPLTYIPSCIGIKLGVFLNLPPIAVFYMGRLFNLLSWIFLVLLAIHITPIHKWTLSLIALSPMMLFLGASFSPDAMLNGLCFLIVTFFLSIVSHKEAKLRLHQIIGFTILVIVIALCKQVYITFAGLLLFIPISRFGNLRNYFIYTLVPISLITVIVFSWYQYVSPKFIPNNPGSIPLEQFQMIKNNPVKFSEIFISSINTELDTWKRMFIGVLGWLDTGMPEFVYDTYLIILLVTALLDSRENIILPIIQRVGLFGVFLLTCLGVITSMFINWTPVGSEIIIGVQGRYFIPVAYPFFLQLYHKRLSLLKPLLNPVVFLYATVVLSTLLYSLLVRYYF